MGPGLSTIYVLCTPNLKAIFLMALFVLFFVYLKFWDRIASCRLGWPLGIPSVLVSEVRGLQGSSLCFEGDSVTPHMRWRVELSTVVSCQHSQTVKTLESWCRLRALAPAEDLGSSLTPTWGWLITTHSSSFRGPDAHCWRLWAPGTYMLLCHHTCRKTTHAHKISKSFFFFF